MLGNLLIDPSGKPSAMRGYVGIVIVSACAILVGTAYGWADPGMTQEAIWMIGIALGGKAVQRMTEKPVEKPKTDDSQ